MPKVLARHNRWVTGCSITESYYPDEEKRPARRRFTATINGWQNFRIYDGPLFEGCAYLIIDCVRTIQSRIDAGDDSVFEKKGLWLTAPETPAAEDR